MIICIVVWLVAQSNQKQPMQIVLVFKKMLFQDYWSLVIFESTYLGPIYASLIVANPRKSNFGFLF